MKTLIASLTLATLIAAPAFGQPAAAATIERHSGLWTQDCHVTYHGFPLCDWYKPSPWP